MTTSIAADQISYPDHLDFRHNLTTVSNLAIHRDDVIALGLPRNFRRRGLLGDGAAAGALPPIAGPAVVLSGSCSEATRRRGRRARAATRQVLFSNDRSAAILEEKNKKLGRQT